MQTFLPYPDFDQTMKCLDWRRLGKQRVETFQILKTLRDNPTSNWARHPAVKMWRGHESSLSNYLAASIREWVARGYRNTMDIPRFNPRARPPVWLGDAAFHASHRSNLLRKAPEHYYQFGWHEPDDLEYVWPVS